MQVLVDGNQEARRVMLGLSDDSNTEILDGLTDKDTVVIPTVASAAGAQRTPAIGIPGGGFGGGGFAGPR